MKNYKKDLNACIITIMLLPYPLNEEKRTMYFDMKCVFVNKYLCDYILFDYMIVCSLYQSKSDTLTKPNLK